MLMDTRELCVLGIASTYCTDLGRLDVVVLSACQHVVFPAADHHISATLCPS